jgi:hypothetical protein
MLAFYVEGRAPIESGALMSRCGLMSYCEVRVCEQDPALFNQSNSINLREASGKTPKFHS